MNLKGTEASSSTPFPGAFERKNPKSMCTMCPSRVMRIFPLCLSFTCRKYVRIEYPAKLCMKFLLAC